MRRRRSLDCLGVDFVFGLLLRRILRQRFLLCRLLGARLLWGLGRSSRLFFGRRDIWRLGLLARRFAFYRLLIRGPRRIKRGLLIFFFNLLLWRRLVLFRRRRLLLLGRRRNDDDLDRNLLLGRRERGAQHILAQQIGDQQAMREQAKRENDQESGVRANF